MPPRMRPKSRATRVAFRRAVWASLALHAVVVCAVALVFRAAEEPERAGPGISTVVDEPQVRITQTDLVSDRPGAATQDPNLVNPWGVAYNPAGPVWVAITGPRSLVNSSTTFILAFAIWISWRASSAASAWPTLI